MSKTYNLDKEKGNIKVSILIIIVGVLIAGGILLFANGDIDPEISGADNDLGLGQSGLEEDLDLDDESVVATVNDQEITRGELNFQLSQLAANPQMQFQVPSPDETEEWENFQNMILEEMISEKLVLQDAKDRGLEPGDEEIDQMYYMIVAELGGQEALDQHLETLGMSETKLRSDLKDQIVIDQYIQMLSEEENIPPATDEDIEEYYEQQVALDPEAPELEEIYEQLREQVFQERLGEVIFEIIEDLEDDSDVEFLL